MPNHLKLSNMQEIPSQLPKRNCPLSRWLGRRILALLGWSVEGRLPGLRKAVLTVAPHTSNWDFVIGMSAALALDLDANWLGKQTLFKGFGGSLLRKLGGIPVDRGHPDGILEQIIAACHNQPQFLLAIAPEGTRKPVSPWKSGCCRIAQAAQIPLVPVAFDYTQKKIRIFNPWVPDQDLGSNMTRLSRHYSAAMAKKPENFLLDTHGGWKN